MAEMKMAHLASLALLKCGLEAGGNCDAFGCPHVKLKQLFIPSPESE
jgi:hypothetical protein